MVEARIDCFVVSQVGREHPGIHPEVGREHPGIHPEVGRERPGIHSEVGRGADAVLGPLLGTAIVLAPGHRSLGRLRLAVVQLQLGSGLLTRSQKPHREGFGGVGLGQSFGVRADGCPERWK